MKGAWTHILILAILLASCNQEQFAKNPLGNSQEKAMHNENTKLSQELMELGYTELFFRMGYENLEKVWEKSENGAQLISLIQDSSQHSYGRFLASEILFHKQPGFISATAADERKTLTETLGKLYAQALQNRDSKDFNDLIPGNVWGFLYYMDDQGLGGEERVGKNLLQIGKGAVVPLMALLSDGEKVGYIGSREATTGNMLNYRVKDVAAYFLGKILDIKVTFHENWEDRDQEIKALITKVNSIQSSKAQ